MYEWYRHIVEYRESEAEGAMVALSDPKILNFIDGQEIKKVIMIPKKIINIVI